MTYRIVQVYFGIEHEHGPFGTFEEAVVKARATGVECSVWDDDAKTNWGSQLVAVVSPISGLRDLRPFAGRMD